MIGTFEALEEKVIQWAIDRGIVHHSNPRAQLLKMFSEAGEIADGEAKGKLDDIEDGVGDVLVCLIIYCHFYGLSVPGCLDAAWNEIKDRKGRMIEGGVFIKDEQ
jgi:NTP pyrophosphatase (non-canonical NTP hydrolase)